HGLGPGGGDGLRVRALVAGGAGRIPAPAVAERRLPGLHLGQPAGADDDLRALRLPAPGPKRDGETSPAGKRRPITWSAASRNRSLGEATLGRRCPRRSKRWAFATRSRPEDAGPNGRHERPVG